ncbi:MAG: DUF4258 domain-containing protein, partial [Actinobacteria bacterium]|nr:DUF4258 domain-containing protein [Actinomycetota bacterium]
VYSSHARRQMAKRSIIEEEVEAVVASPHWTTDTYAPRGGAPRTNYWSRLDGRLLKVTVANADVDVVVTVVAPEEERTNIRSMRSIVVTYDSVVDALDIQLRPGATAARTMAIDERRNVDLDDAGQVIAIEVLSPSEGMSIDEIIGRFELFDCRDELLRVAEMDFRPTQLA